MVDDGASGGAAHDPAGETVDGLPTTTPHAERHHGDRDQPTDTSGDDRPRAAAGHDQAGEGEHHRGDRRHHDHHVEDVEELPDPFDARRVDEQELDVDLVEVDGVEQGDAPVVEDLPQLVDRRAEVEEDALLADGREPTLSVERGQELGMAGPHRRVPRVGEELGLDQLERGLTEQIGGPPGDGLGEAVERPGEDTFEHVLDTARLHDLLGEGVGDLLAHLRVVEQRLTGRRPGLLVAELGAGPSGRHRRDRAQPGDEDEHHSDHCPSAGRLPTPDAAVPEREGAVAVVAPWAATPGRSRRQTIPAKRSVSGRSTSTRLAARMYSS